MTETATTCESCGQALGARAVERGFRHCYACFLKSKSAVSGPGPNGPAPVPASPVCAPTPASRGASPHDQRLMEMNLRYGCAYVYRHSGKLYGWGDFTHCPKEDIEHNIQRLAAMIRAKPSLTSVGKDYDGDMYQSTEKVDWERLIHEVTVLYKEKLLELDAGVSNPLPTAPMLTQKTCSREQWGGPEWPSPVPAFSKSGKARATALRLLEAK